MLPLSLLKTAINHPMLVELKNGETYNGHLANCDSWMNIYLTQVICTSRDGDRFWKMPECYIRGSTIKYLRISDEVIDNYKEDNSNRGGASSMNRRGDNSNRGGRGGAGGGNQRGGGSQRGGGNRGGASGGNSRGGFNQNNNSNNNNNNNNRNSASTMSSSTGNMGSTNSLGGGRPPAKQARK
jgi:U6 snRNA-associated Sm-like protein LSm4